MSLVSIPIMISIALYLLPISLGQPQVQTPLDEGHAVQGAGIEFWIELVTAGKDKPVRTDYPFLSGDEMVFKMKTDRNVYVYVVNRTITGSAP